MHYLAAERNRQQVGHLGKDRDGKVTGSEVGSGYVSSGRWGHHTHLPTLLWQVTLLTLHVQKEESACMFRKKSMHVQKEKSACMNNRVFQ